MPLVLFLIITVLGLAATGCTDTQVQPTPEAVPEIRPGILQGYLPLDTPLDSKAFVPPAPAPDSPRQSMDDRIAEYMLTLRGSARWELATRDAHLGFPAAAEAFSCALALPITEEDTPDLYMLMRRTLADLGLSTYAAKNAYQRPRPFMVNEAPVCTPEEEEALRADGAYPSGHTAIGWGWGLMLSELSPERAEALIARGRAFGESRNVCNVHWRSDVVSGRMAGAAAFARLHSNEQFQSAMNAAREDIIRARAAGLRPNVDCAAEAAALATPMP
jgi:acid phosphatase (class A)